MGDTPVCPDTPELVVVVLVEDEGGFVGVAVVVLAEAGAVDGEAVEAKVLEEEEVEEGLDAVEVLGVASGAGEELVLVDSLLLVAELELLVFAWVLEELVLNG